MYQDSVLRPYTPPRFEAVGSLGELTQDINKNYAPISDGYTFMHQPINNS